MALRQSVSQLSRKVCQSQQSTASAVGPWQRHQTRQLATPSISPSVTQDPTASKGPTAIVFMNMGGPSTTDEVGDFLSRLFVCFFYPEKATSQRD
jgi:protoporphyrin/coproporphyrin ferrochelatase